VSPDVLPITSPAEKPPRKRPRRVLPRLAVDARRLARLLSSGVRTIRTWDAAGKLPAPVRISGRTLWVLPEVLSWLKAGAPDRQRWEAIKAARRK
jgi:predicted DNA-binding transcriptional regulator AlpA